MHLKLLSLIICFANFNLALSQTGSISGSVKDTNGNPLAFAAVQVVNSNVGTSTATDGSFTIPKVEVGIQILEVSTLGYKRYSTSVNVTAGKNTSVSVQLEVGMLDMNEIVVTGTRTAKRQTDSPVIVNLMSSIKLEQLVASNLAGGLCYQPGIRVESNCQTCNYTQLRMNGLPGGYSQILVNGRPVFSPLTGLYGLEQIPVNMIERVETVRGGVSALYGSSAIGGTVNVITKLPSDNNFSISNTFQAIAGSTHDNIFAGNAALINSAKNTGASFFVNRRTRDAYDANKDNYSELPLIENNAFGVNLFFLPAENQKLEISMSSIYEYRYGGEMVYGPAHLSKQAEERTHNVLIGSLDYELNFDNGQKNLILYYGGQHTDREHYTGILPDESELLYDFLTNPPYGISDAKTQQAGIQFNNKFKRFFGGSAILTAGAEYLYDYVYDEIGSYNYLIDQTTSNLGIFIQQDWNITENLNFLSGFRLDNHNLVDNIILSPRLSLLYKLTKNTQFRLGWGTGFRAPQAFDADMHIAFAGGGVSRISLDENLKEERSNSLTGSLNFDKAGEKVIYGFTLEGFYTTLSDAFYQFPLGSDAVGRRFEKRNGTGATVKGITLEARANFNYVFQFDVGFTVQSGLFHNPVENIEGLPPMREFLRSPNTYGYATLSYSIAKRTVFATNIIFTGPMTIAHYGGNNTGQLIDEYYNSEAFTDLGCRLGHTFTFRKHDTALELFGGIKNVFDAYQSDFDSGKNRDSNFVYGPALPRTFFIGVKLGSL